MSKENAYERISLEDEFLELDKVSIDFDELEKSLQDEIDQELIEVDMLSKDRESLENPNQLMESVKIVIWDQFLNQLGVTGGDEFIADNNGQNLDLRKEAHIQTSENFENGKIATHNTEIDFQKRYDDWQNNFQRNADGSIKMNSDGNPVLRKNITGSEDYNTNYNAREFIDKGRPTGTKTVNKDHTISAGEIIRDPEAAAFMSREKQAEFANSEKNLVDLDAAANQSKGDKKMGEWLDSERDGKKPSERFNIDEEELRKRDREARKEYQKEKEEGKKEAIESGKQSQKEEAFKIGKYAIKAILFSLLAGLLREVVAGFVKWLTSKDKSLKSLMLSLKNAFISFIFQLKHYVIYAAEVAVTVILEAIFGPIVRLFRRIWMILKQGLRSFKQSIDYLKEPSSQSKPSDIKAMELGKIVVGGITAVGGIFLTQAIEAGLTYLGQYCPALIYEVPVIGSLASVIAIFLGGLLAGISGAMIMLLLDKTIERTKVENTEEKIIEIGNSVLKKQGQLVDIKETKMEMVRDETVRTIIERHKHADEKLEDIYSIVNEDSGIGVIDFSQIEDPLSEIWKRINKI